jgi:predicted DNA-binding protein (MmcQ/YjbR family)
MDDGALKDYLRESHRLASLNLPKKVQRELGLNLS